MRNQGKVMEEDQDMVHRKYTLDEHDEDADPLHQWVEEGDE